MKFSFCGYLLLFVCYFLIPYCGDKGSFVLEDRSQLQGSHSLNGGREFENSVENLQVHLHRNV